MHTLFEHKSNNKTVNTVFFCTFTMKKLKNMNQNSKLFLLDAYALIYRAYYAFIKNPRINSKGFNTSAILGFVNTLEEVLKKLKEVGKQLVVATSKPEVFAREIIRYFHLDSYFSYVAGMELDGGRGTKAEVIEYAIRSCGAEDRREVLMIGDRKHDVIGARQAGIDCVGVLYGFGS